MPRKKEETGTDLIHVGDDSPYAVLQMEDTELRGLIQENIGTDEISAHDLDRVKVPSGAGTTWEVPGLDGLEPAKEIEGVIVARTTRRAYWPKKYDGSDDPPACSSDDGVTGRADVEAALSLGIPAEQACAECPFNEFGSAEDGVSKACKETRQLFVLTADSLLPIVVTLPPGSLSAAKAYFMRLLRARLKPTDVVTKISLEKAESQGGIAYSRVVLKAGEHLAPDASLRLKEYAAALQPTFTKAAVDRSEVEA